MPDKEERASSPDGAPVSSLDDDVLVVGVGASAGGLEALEKFFRAVPSDSGMAFVVVLHLDPERESQVAEILERYAPFPVIQVSEPVAIEADHAYVIAPHTEIELDGDRLVPTVMADGKRPHYPIDTFFRSLSVGRGADGAAVVLSGTADDGTLGLRRIREQGGITVAQTPAEAAYSGMPQSAIATGMVEVVLPANEIPAKLIELRGVTRRPDAMGAETAEEALPPETTAAALARIVAALREATGRDFTGYKRSTIFRRIDRRLRFNGLDDINDYVQLVEADEREARILFKDLLISVSRFFRDPEAWAFLEEEVVADLFAGKSADDSVRVWVPGCATGEEAYTVAMLLHEHALGLDRPPPQIQIFATDIDEDALAFARGGAYPMGIEEDVGEGRTRRFFTREEGRRHIGRAIRDSVLFAIHDIRNDPPFSDLDMVSCRNLLIYMESEVQKSVLERIHYGLRENGVLFLGSSESPDGEYFEPISKKHRVYRRNPGSSPIPLTREHTPKPARTPRTGPARRKRDATEQLEPATIHGKLLGELGFPSAVVNAQYAIVHLSKGMGPYLHYPEGEPTPDIMELVAEPVELELRTALYRAFHYREASKHTVRMEVDGERTTVGLDVRPGPEGTPLEPYALVIMEEQSDQEDEPDEIRRETATDTMVRELEEELRRTKEHLQATVEEREATIEELQSANEELQSVNEEQQAAQEELEARREELQSLNEELATVNQEHRAKIEELDEVNADLRNLIASTEIATVFLNQDMEVRRFTPASEKIFNLRSQDEGRAFSDITHKLKGVEDLMEECRRVLETGEPLAHEARSRDGLWYNVRLLPYRSAEGEPEGVVITCYDISSQKEMEEELRRARDQAQEAERTKSNFVATISHELRTPLNALLGYVQLLGEEVWGPLTEEQARYLTRMEACAKHLDFMIGQILTFSRMEEGKETIDPESVDVGELIEDVASILGPRAGEKGLDLEVERESGDFEMTTDVGKVRQILLNLGGNAIKFTEEGRVVLAVRPDEDHVEFEVRDTGVGIARENQERIFERFWQVREDGRSPGEGGTGLGLAVTRGLTELLGGRVEVESELGEGSVFRVLLPRTVEE